MCFVNPAMLHSLNSSERLMQIRDKINNFCHYKTEHKLLIIDQVESFCSEETDRRELMSLIANVCTPDGQLLAGWESSKQGVLKVLLCMNAAWIDQLNYLGIGVPAVRLAMPKAATVYLDDQ